MSIGDPDESLPFVPGVDRPETLRLSYSPVGGPSTPTVGRDSSPSCTVSTGLGSSRLCTPLPVGASAPGRGPLRRPTRPVRDREDLYYVFGDVRPKGSRGFWTIRSRLT